jgi:hypothetical protein
MLLIKRSPAIPIRIGFYYVHEKKLAMVSPKGNPKTSRFCVFLYHVKAVLPFITYYVGAKPMMVWHYSWYCLRY